MLKVTIKTALYETFREVETKEEADAFINLGEESLWWGKPAWTETILATDDTPEHYIQHPAE